MIRKLNVSWFILAAVSALAALAAAQAAVPAIPAAHLHWMGRDWTVTNGRNGGIPGAAEGSPDNVWVDAHGFLHLRIAKHDGIWTAAELKSRDRLGFGTYQWQVEGDVFRMEPSTVLGLFLYGPAAHAGVDGENEIDVTEFSQWNGRCHCNADFAVFYPPAGHSPGRPDAHWSNHFTVAGDGSHLTTVRMVWRPSIIVFTVMAGLQPFGVTARVLKTDTYRADADHIPQVPLPVAMNLWSSKVLPTRGQSVILRRFQYQPL